VLALPRGSDVASLRARTPRTTISVAVPVPESDLFPGISYLLATSAASAFLGLCVRLPGVTADGRARLPFRWAGDLLLRSVIAVAIALVPTSRRAGPPTSASAARTLGASRGRRRAPAAREGSCLRLAGPWPFAGLLGWHLASCGPIVMHEASTACDPYRVSAVLRG
jgi:hypothetical protein